MQRVDGLIKVCRMPLVLGRRACLVEGYGVGSIGVGDAVDHFFDLGQRVAGVQIERCTVNGIATDARVSQ